MSELPAEQARRSNLTLWIVMLACAAPVILSYLVFYFFPPSTWKTHGELLPTRQLSDAPFHTLEGQPASQEPLRGKWLLVTVQSGACDEACAIMLFTTRQLRQAQGRELARVQRVWLLRDDAPPNPRVIPAHPDMLVLRAKDHPWLQSLSAPDGLARYFYVIDPRGYQVFRYRDDADKSKTIKEINRLLKNNPRYG